MTAGGAAPPLRFAELLPEPGQLWIRYRPRRWPGAPGRWLDLARGAFGRPSAGDAGLPGAEPAELDDVVYLPPVADRLEPERRDLAERLSRAGAPVLYQLVAGQAPAPAAATAVYDLTAALAGRDLDALGAVAGCTLWGLLPGITDRPELVSAGLERLRAAGAEYVVGLVPELQRGERRELLESGVAADPGAEDQLFRALFHGPPPSLRAFARQVQRAGLSPFFPRPLPAATTVAGNRQLAGGLAWAAELWLRLGQPEGRAQTMFRAARKIDRESHDFLRLAREGNLGVVDWLDPECRTVVEELAVHGGAALIRSLEEAYLAGDGEGR